MTNKEIKTKKVKKRRLNIKRVFILALLIFLAILIPTKIFKVTIKGTTVIGNNYLSDSAIIKAGGLNSDTSLLKLSEKKICKKIKTLKIVDTCEIKKTWNMKVKITITENKPLFYYTSQNKIALSNGTFIEENNKFGVPTLINYVPEKILLKFITGLNDIDDDIIRSISEIEYSPSQNGDGTFIDEGRFMLNMNDGNTVYVNNTHIDVLNYYKRIYASIGDKKGTYYFDCDFDNYYFKEY